MTTFTTHDPHTSREPDEVAPATLAENCQPQQPRIRARAILLGLALLPVNAFLLVDMEYTRYSAHPTTVSLFLNCIFILLVLAGLNKAVAKIKYSAALTQAELLLVYSMLCIGSCVAGHDFLQQLVGSLAWPYFNSAPDHNYEKLFWRFLPKWAMVSDTNATYGFFHGNDTLYTREHIAAWLPAVLVWTAFIGVLLWAMQCINVLIRKQWTDNERLSYPLVKMPLEITATQPFGHGGSGLPLTKNRLFWIGFGIAATMDIVNSLNYYYPSIPAILTAGGGRQMLNLQDFAATKPWNAIGWTPLAIYPFVIGLGMLLPMDFLFSSWFFYILWKLQAVTVVMMAWDADPKMPYANYQALGAYLLFFTSTIYLSRTYLKNVLRCALGKATSLDDADEPMRYRTALLNLGVSLAALIGFAVMLGMSWWVAPLFFFLYFAIALAITRMRAEMGTPVHDLHFTGPDWTISNLVGAHALGPQSLGAFSILFWFNRAYRCHPMPVQLEALKLAEASGSRSEMRKWIGALLVAGIIGTLCGFWAILHLTYIHGNPIFGQEAWDRYSNWMTTPNPPNANVSLAIVVGFVFAGLMQVMRTTGLWWPFHPLAYAVSGSWEMNLLWSSLLVAWMVKGITLRFGGAQGYLKSLPFFYGLILGQFVPGMLLNIWGLIANAPTYQFWQ